VSTAQEIENAIRSLSAAERDKLVQHIPQLFPEFGGDLEWERIAHDDKPRPALIELLNRYETDMARDSDAFPKVAEGDFDSHA
jgi:hypothetical protein